MTTAPLVSIVIPAYNAEAFIDKTLDSVRAQTFTDYEIIVVDDGSADKTTQTADNYLKTHHLPGRAIRQENKKIAGARNTGISAAAGQFIALLDHDDFWHPKKLERVMREFEKHPEADLICSNERIVKNGKHVSDCINGPACADMYERLLFKGNALSPSATVFRKTKALEIGGFRENPEFNTVEDYDFWLRLSQVANFRFINEFLGEYQLVERAASRQVEYHHTNLEAMLLDHFKTRYGQAPSPLEKIRMRKRLAMVYRSALGFLIKYGENPGLQKQYLGKMLRAYPLDWKNLGRAAQWFFSRGNR